MRSQRDGPSRCALWSRNAANSIALAVTPAAVRPASSSRAALISETVVVGKPGYIFPLGIIFSSDTILRSRPPFFLLLVGELIEDVKTIPKLGLKYPLSLGRTVRFLFFIEPVP